MHLPTTSARIESRIFYAAVLLLLVCGGAYSSLADTFVVTSVADPGDGICSEAGIGDGCTLRESINAANSAPGADTIDAAGVTGVIQLTGVLPDLSSDLNINGPGASALIVRRNTGGDYRIFNVKAGVTVNISGLTVTNGHVPDGANAPLNGFSNPGGAGDSVGGILNAGTLYLADVEISGNRAGNGGTGFLAPGGVGGFAGGICNTGTLTLTRCTVSDNQTGKGGAGGYAPGGDGGGIYNTGMLTIIDSTISDNRAGNGGGGGGKGGGSGGYRGGIYNSGTASFVSSTISGNRAGDGANGVPGSGRAGAGGGIANFGTLTLSNSTISGNQTGAGISGGFHGQGGGIYGGPMTISNSTITANRVPTTNDLGNQGSGIYGYASLRSTIVAGNFEMTGWSDIAGTVQSDGYNLINDQRGADIRPNPGAGPDFYGPANLDPLADNGGPTQTHLPRSGSLAIDKGKNFSASSTDQRGPGFARTVDQMDATYPNAGDGTDIGAVELAAPGTPVIARNISTRAKIETGDNVMIAGFIITGTLPKKVVIRGIGPSLQDMNVVEFLEDPVLELRRSDGSLIVGNDNWQDDPAQAAQIQAAGLAPTRSQESAIEVTLVPGSYTAIVLGKNNTSGIGLVEVYDVDNSESQLVNLSTRGLVHGGDSVMIAGFTLGGTNNTARIAIRALGPSLSNAGLTNVLEDPAVELRDENGSLMVSNDNWNDDAASAAKLTANGLALPDANESGIFADALPPGQFTAIVAGKNGGIGIALVEVYNLN